MQANRPERAHTMSAMLAGLVGLVCLVASVATVATVGACQSGQSAPGTASTASGGNTGGATSATGDAAIMSLAADAGIDAPEPAHVALPRSPSTPPRRTTRPLDKKELESLSAVDFKDFRRDVHRSNGHYAMVDYTTVTRPYLRVTVLIDACDRSPHARRPCIAMDLERWKARTSELKHLMHHALVDRPDTRFDIGSLDLAGATAIWTYQVGAFFDKDERNQPTGIYTDLYRLYYNDGINQIRCNAAYVDDTVGGVQQLIAVAPPEDLARLADAFLRYFVHEWK